MTAPMRVLLVGDLHANTGAAFEVIDYAAAVRADLILQLGDFGFWPRDLQGRTFLRKVEKRLALRGLNLWWIDGNHEDFDGLTVLPIGEDGRREISEHVWHLPRGYRWQWGATTWVAVGGAVSVDKNYRTEGKTWFAAEELTHEERRSDHRSRPRRRRSGPRCPSRGAVPSPPTRSGQADLAA